MNFRSAFAALSLPGLALSACASVSPATAVAVPSATQPSVPTSIAPPSPAPSTTERVGQLDSQRAIAVIRNFMGAPSLHLAFVETALMINAPNADLVVAVFADDTGTTFSVDPESYRVVELNPIVYALSGGTRLTRAELRARAHQMAEQYILGFVQIQDRLTYEEGAKEDTFFFRWEDRASPWIYNPPVLQVGIRVDGKLVSYLNTIPGP